MKEITMVREADVKQAVKAVLTKQGWMWWMPPANGFGKAGLSDFHALRDGVFLAVETKFGNGKLTALQRQHLKSVERQNGIAFVVDEKNYLMFGEWALAFDRAKDSVQGSGAELKDGVLVEGAASHVAPDDGALMLDCMRALTKHLQEP